MHYPDMSYIRIDDRKSHQAKWYGFGNLDKIGFRFKHKQMMLAFQHVTHLIIRQNNILFS